MSKSSPNILGRSAEEKAARFLEQQGYTILQKNYRTRWAEVDIIASHEGALVFVEVKARNSVRYGAPAEAVTSSKQQKIVYAAMHYMRENNISEDIRVRFDVVIMVGNQVGVYEIRVIQNAFRPA